MEFPITILLLPVVGVFGVGVVCLFFSCKKYWDEQEKHNQPPVEGDRKP